MKEILETKNYDLFKKLEGNRATTIDRINKIKKSIMEVGYITSPILVNENMEIIDGQGRFEALRELKLPVEYIMQPGLNFKECVAMNVYQTNWNIMDYIKSYAEKGNQNYVYLYKLLEEFPLLRNINMYATVIKEQDKFFSSTIKNGELQISEEEYEEAKEKIREVYELIEKYRKVSRFQWILKGMIYCLFIPDIDKKRLKEKVTEVLEADKIPAIPTADEAMQFLEAIYNKNKKGMSLFIYTEYRKRLEERLLRGSKKMKEVFKRYKEEK